MASAGAWTNDESVRWKQYLDRLGDIHQDTEALSTFLQIVDSKPGLNLIDQVFSKSLCFAARLLDSSPPKWIAARICFLFAVDTWQAVNPASSVFASCAVVTPERVADIVHAHCVKNTFRLDVSQIPNLKALPSVTSPRFECGGILFQLRFYPAGKVSRASEGKASLYLEALSACTVKFDLIMNNSRGDTISYEFGGGCQRGYPNVCNTSSTFTNIGVFFYFVDSKEVPSKSHDPIGLLSWAQNMSESDPHTPLARLHAAIGAKKHGDESLLVVGGAITEAISSPQLCLQILRSALSCPVPGRVVTDIYLKWAIDHWSELVMSAEWLTAEVQIVSAIIVHIKKIRRTCCEPEILEGVVAWAQYKQLAANEALERIVELGSAADLDQNALRRFVGRLFDVCGESSQPLVEKIMVDEWSDLSCPPRSKRRRVDESAILQAAASWARPRLKHLQTTAAWRPAAIAQIAVNECRYRYQEQHIVEGVRAAVSSWARPAKTSQVLELLEHLSSHWENRDLSAELLRCAKEKAALLERGHHQEALAAAEVAAARAEAHAILARSEAEVLTSACKAQVALTASKLAAAKVNEESAKAEAQAAREFQLKVEEAFISSFGSVPER